jgi:hypothetical protein
MDAVSIKRTIDLYNGCPSQPSHLAGLSWEKIHRALVKSPAFRSATLNGPIPIVDAASTVIDTLVDLGWRALDGAPDA